jgi:hypothetical protein
VANERQSRWLDLLAPQYAQMAAAARSQGRLRSATAATAPASDRSPRRAALNCIGRTREGSQDRAAASSLRRTGTALTITRTQGCRPHQKWRLGRRRNLQRCGTRPTRCCPARVQRRRCVWARSAACVLVRVAMPAASAWPLTGSACSNAARSCGTYASPMRSHMWRSRSAGARRTREAARTCRSPRAAQSVPLSLLWR